MGSFSRKLRRIAVTDSLFLHIINKLDNLIGKLARKMAYRKGKVVRNKVFVMTYDDTYSCNPKYIVEELLRRKLPLDIVCVTPEDEHADVSAFPMNVRLVQRKSFEMFEEMASARIWIDNALSCVWYGMPKKKDQVYFNTWHGSMGIKKLGGPPSWLKRAKKCNALTDYCITNSQFEENVFRSTFWPGVSFLPFGHARNDILFDVMKRAEIRQEVCSALHIEDPESRLFLYAPTFRDDKNMSWFDVDFAEVKKSLEQRFGGSWTILVRMHYKNRTVLAGRLPETEWLVDATAYSDMQKLMAAVDAGMTDYSSWAYDYILTGRPLFLYAPDVKKYDQERGFYFPLESTPFPLAYNGEELLDAIRTFDETEYLRKVEVFLKDKGCYEDGHACERIADKIEELTLK